MATTYVYKRTALFRDNVPLSAAGVTSVDGFVLDGIEPTGTRRRVLFSHESGTSVVSISSTQSAASDMPTYYKLTVDSTGKATETKVSITDLTAEAVLENGNTVEELAAAKSIPDFVGKDIYPVIAIEADEDATTVPTLKMSIKTTNDTSVFEKEEESQVYRLADVPVSVVSIDANTASTGKGSVVVTARFYNGNWTDYMSLTDVSNISASAVQLKAKYAVTTIGSDTAKVTDATIVYSASTAKVSGSTAEVITATMHFAEETGNKGASFAQALIKHKKLMDADIKAYASFRTEPKTREMVAIGTGTGQSQTYALADSNINHDSLVVQINGVPFYGFAYNTETNQVTVSADKDAAITASYEYDWEDEDWKEMTFVSRQVYDADENIYASRFQYTLPSTETDKTICAVKFELIRPNGDVTDEVLGTGTGDTQVFVLPHYARKDTISCTGAWNYNDDTRVLTVIADKGADIKVSYHWVAESHEIYGLTAGWAEEQ